jgi:hypothetical protein
MLESPVQRCLLKKGPRLFGLLGRPTPAGLAGFGPAHLVNHWALTAEWGCLRLERLTGEEEVTGHHLFLPTALCYDYGVTACNRSPAVARAVFGLLSWELDKLVAYLRRGGFPVLGFSRTDLLCAITGCIIPAYWPHVVTSNHALHGNVVSLETFIRILVSSLPEGQLAARFPQLQTVFRQMLPLTLPARPGVPYLKEILELAPAALALK